MSNPPITKAKKPVHRIAKRKATEPQFLVIGTVLRPHGVRGELRLQIQTDTPNHLHEVDTVYIGEDYQPYALESFRLHSGVLLFTLGGVEDRDAADQLRGLIVAVKFSEAAPLKEGEYYHHQIVGLKVVTDEGEALGLVTEIITTGANDVYVIRGESEVLLPAIKSVILKIEPPQMIVHVLDGLR